MREILFLSHRIPYPPDKGDKIRSWNLVKGLAERFVVHLGAFVDDPMDWRHEDALRRTCGEVFLRKLDPRVAKIRGLAAMLGGSAITVGYYRDAEFRRWVEQLALTRPLLGVYAFSSSMAQYAVGIRIAESGGRVADYCDVDSDKWRQYSASRRWPLSSLFSREARLLEADERRFAMQFDATLVVSEAERQLMCRVAPGAASRIKVVSNGVDTKYFDPTGQWEDPYPSDSRPIVFTGAMDYHANVDGVVWFANHVLPEIRKRHPDALFAVVGSNPSSAVKDLAVKPGVMVTGRVPDVRPYLAHARVAVAPLRIARGVQNKVLEALAMGRRVVATDNAIQGIPDAVQAGVIVSSDPGRFAEAVIACLGVQQNCDQGRDFVLRCCSWSRQVKEVSGLLEATKWPPNVEFAVPRQERTWDSTDR